MMSSSSVSRDQVSSFLRDGAVPLRGVFSPQWVEAIRAGIDRSLREPSDFGQRLTGGGGGAYFNDYCNWRKIPEFRDLVFNSPAAKVAGMLIGEGDRSWGQHIPTHDNCTHL